MNVLFSFITAAMVLLAMSFVVPPFRTTLRTRGIARLPLLAVTLVILLAIGLYLAIGRPDAMGLSVAQPQWPQSGPRQKAAATPAMLGSVASLVDGLREKLQREPDDADGWLLLARSYQHLGRLEEARRAQSMAAELGKPDAKLAAVLAEASPVSGTHVEIRGRVRLAATAAGSVDGADTVFVLARAVGGSSMPLAVLQKPASALPFDFVLDDDAAMVRGNSLSQAGKIIVSAMISKSGDAMQTEQGYTTHSGPVDTRRPDFLDLEIGPGAGAVRLSNKNKD